MSVTHVMTQQTESGFKCFMTTGKAFHSVQNDKELVHLVFRWPSTVFTLPYQVWSQGQNLSMKWNAKCQTLNRKEPKQLK